MMEVKTELYRACFCDKTKHTNGHQIKSFHSALRGKKHFPQSSRYSKTHRANTETHTHPEAIETANSEVCINSKTGFLYVRIHKSRLLAAQT